MKNMEESMKTAQNAPNTTEDDLPPVRSGAITLTSQGVCSMVNVLIGWTVKLENLKFHSGK